MPTNLPPNAQAAEKRFREAETVEDRIEALEEYIGLIPKHKGTDHLRADLRRQLSKLKSSAQARKKTGRQDSAFRIDREGVGQAVLVGPTNCGKSALLAALTGATPEVSEAPYTTWDPTPGMMMAENVCIQLIDTPPLNRDFVEPDFLNLIRRSDLILLVVDLQTDPLQQLEDTIAILDEHHIVPNTGTQHRQERDAEDDRRLTCKPVLVVANKDDAADTDELFEIFCQLLDRDWSVISASAATGRHLDRLRRAVFDQLNIMRIYSKAPGKEADLTAPFVLPKNSTVAEFARRLHKDFYENLKAARVWGSGVFEGQLVGRDHVLRDGDVVELRI